MLEIGLQIEDEIFILKLIFNITLFQISTTYKLCAGYTAAMYEKYRVSKTGVR